MRFKEEDINALYLGIEPSKICKTSNFSVQVVLLSSKKILEIQLEAENVYPDNELLKNVYMRQLVAYNAVTIDNWDFELFITEFSLEDINEIVKVHDELIENAPKLEFLNEQDIEDISGYLKKSSMQRYKWSLCEKFSTPPNILFGTGEYLTDEQVLWCFVMEKIDRDEKMEHWCENCKEKLLDENRCWNCGEPIIKQDNGKSDTFDDDEWLRRAYGVWNDKTQRFEIPDGYTFDEKEKCWILEETNTKDYTTKVSHAEPIDDLFPTELEEQDNETYIEENYEPNGFDDFRLNEEDED